MRRLTSRKVLAGAAGVTLAAAGIALAPLALAQPQSIAPPTEELGAVHTDDLPSAAEIARREAREEALAGVLTGKYTAYQDGPSLVVDLGEQSSPVVSTGSNGNGRDKSDGVPNTNGAKKRYVELAREATDRIFVILVEFGDTPSPYPPAADAQRTEGPLHNEIPEPDRAVDNSTVWQADYGQAYFDDLYFGEGESVKNYFEAQSSGRYSVEGTVTDWVKVDYTQGRYGTNLCGSNVCSTVYALVRDASKQWVQDQLASGKSMAEVQALLAEHDVWDRYDLDGDGDFNEPDGFLDHFQIVHAGGDEADGDPIYGGDAIWSHRSYSALAYYPPGCNPAVDCLDTGTPIGGTIEANFNVVDDGTYTGLYIGDYTMQPENGGRSVFYHEYAHDLGLPDDYNILSGGDNNNEHWTLMAQSRLGAADDGGIGERGGDLGAWNKLQLGWLNYEVVGYQQKKTVQLGPQEYNTNRPQAVVVVLPDQEIDFDLGEPAEGDSQFYSGHTDETTIAIFRDVTVPAGGGELTFQAKFDIETDWDYAYVAVDGVAVAGTVGGVPTNPNPNQWNAIDYFDGTVSDWVDASFALPEGDHQIAVVYQTDPAVSGNDPAQLDGLFVDDLQLDGVALSEDGWSTTGGFALVGAALTELFPHFYIGGWRSYVSYDQYLKTGPYWFTDPPVNNWVDHYAYQDGLLISYWNTAYANNDTFAHPGAGRNLYIDAHPEPFAQTSTGDLWRARVQVYDATFGKDTTDTVTLHVGGVANTFGGLPGVSTFKDTDKYFYDELPNHGVKLPGYGVTIRVLNDSGGKMQIKVN